MDLIHVPVSTRNDRNRAFLALLALARNRGGPANGQIYWRWWYPEVGPNTRLHDINPEPNTEAIQDLLIAQQQRYPQRFFYSINPANLNTAGGNPPQNGPAVPPPPPPFLLLLLPPPPPLLPPGPVAGPSAAGGSGNSASATVSVPPQGMVIDDIGANLEMEVDHEENQNPHEMLNLGGNFQPLIPGMGQANDQVDEQPLPVIEADQELDAILALGDGNVPVPMLDPEYLPEISQDFINYVFDDDVDDFSALYENAPPVMAIDDLFQGQDIDEDEEQ